MIVGIINPNNKLSCLKFTLHKLINNEYLTAEESNWSKVESMQKPVYEESTGHVSLNISESTIEVTDIPTGATNDLLRVNFESKRSNVVVVKQLSI